MHRVPNYIAALKSILIELSKQCKHKFPPPDYKSPCSYAVIAWQGELSLRRASRLPWQ